MKANIYLRFKLLPSRYFKYLDTVDNTHGKLMPPGPHENQDQSPLSQGQPIPLQLDVEPANLLKLWDEAGRFGDEARRGGEVVDEPDDVVDDVHPGVGADVDEGALVETAERLNHQQGHDEEAGLGAGPGLPLPSGEKVQGPKEGLGSRDLEEVDAQTEAPEQGDVDAGEDVKVEEPPFWDLAVSDQTVLAGASGALTKSKHKRCNDRNGN